MKYLILIVLILWMMPGLSAQEFDVRSFAADPTDLAARRYEKRTVNDEPAALVKVITNINGMLFDSNIGIVDVEHKDEGYWVYVAPRERRITLMASSYIPKDVELPEPAQPNMVYRMVVATKGIAMPTTDLMQVTFRINQDNVLIQTGNMAPVLSPGRNSVHSLAKGQHSFRFIKDGFAELTQTIDVQEDKVIDITLEPGEATTTLALPGYIIIESDPPGAEVYLNEQRVGTTPYQGRQLAGNYSLMLSHPMYHEHNQQFLLGEGATVNLPVVEMKPRFGYFKVNSTPSGAEVLLDGRALGTSPLPRGEISSGQHELKIRKALYHEYTETFFIEDGDDKQFDINLRAAFGHLLITSDPNGADVFLDGRQVGTTPYENLQQPSGRYNVRLSKDLYSDANEQIVVSDSEKTERFIAMSMNFGTLEVTAEGAEIYIDGRRVATGNWRANLSPGQYSLRATQDLHTDDEREVFVVVGQTENINLTPRPRQGVLSIETQPFETRGAEIFIDGRKRSETTPAVLPLLIGSYDVSVVKDGFLEANETVEIREGLEHELTFTMQTFEGSMLQQVQRHKRSKRWYGTAALATAGAGAYFQYSTMQLADEYKTATSDATSIYNRYEQHQLISYVAFGVAVPLGVMMLVKSGQQRRLQREVDMAFVPVDGGGFFTLRVGF